MAPIQSSAKYIHLLPQNLGELNIEEMLGGRMNRNIGEQDVQLISNHMNVVIRCHFQLRGEKKFAALVDRLKEFVENLLKMCSEVQAQVNRKPLGLGKIANTGDPEN